MNEEGSDADPICIDAALQAYRHLKSCNRPKPFLFHLVRRFFDPDTADWRLPDGVKVHDMRLKREFATAWQDDMRSDLLCVTRQRAIPNKLLRGLLRIHNCIIKHASYHIVRPPSKVQRGRTSLTNEVQDHQQPQDEDQNRESLSFRQPSHPGHVWRSVAYSTIADYDSSSWLDYEPHHDLRVYFFVCISACDWCGGD